MTLFYVLNRLLNINEITHCLSLQKINFCNFYSRFAFVSSFPHSTEWGKLSTHWFCLSNDWNEKYCSSRRNFMVQKWTSIINHITVHEWTIRESSNFVIWWSRSVVDVLQKVAAFHFIHHSVVNIPLAINGRTFTAVMLLQFKQTDHLFAQQRSRRPMERVSGKFIDVAKFQKCRYETWNVVGANSLLCFRVHN